MFVGIPSNFFHSLIADFSNLSAENGCAGTLDASQNKPNNGRVVVHIF
jgi:hypothetical protein